MKIHLKYCLITLCFTTILACKEKAQNNLVVKDSLPSYPTEVAHIKAYAKANNYNQKIAFFIDFSLHSGKKRFFVVDLTTDTIIKQGVVCHGDGKGKNKSDFATAFSNTTESHMSSLGIAIVQERAYSNWGKQYKYWLKGVESTNDKMRERIVVLHAWSNLPDEEVYPNSIAMSWGCPTVSIKFLDELDVLLKNEKKVLLYSFQ